MWEAVSHKGQRPYQEDRCLAIPGKVGIFAIFDGHRGSQGSGDSIETLLTGALSAAIADIEAELLNESERGGFVAGSTACIAAISGETVVVMNLGDSRAIICGVEAGDCVRLTRDHQPYWEDERKRIEAAGGVIHSNGRLFGEFEVSRAIGDRDLKKFGMSAVPEFTVYHLQRQRPSPLYLLVGSDGVFEKLRFQGVCETVIELLRNGEESGIASRVITKALVAGTSDNLTLVVAKLV
ncbi:probable protein phosphatase 2C 8 [Selaginella moellendorffii]|uniref:probable protein phosphatase 2C 8 n=1 Tax=Selaginella moellendorffii TaxID=88036 RepID=UPI000D1C2FA5|nr:probable protein phosphatase 2C 8 [Selaginella moellendorffii]|eukprot:XP_002969292.2 probable protein phosphatase 2C 8 [Selaginella moellendorffii]